MFRNHVVSQVADVSTDYEYHGSNERTSCLLNTCPRKTLASAEINNIAADPMPALLL